MQFINKRHLDIPTKILSVSLFGLSMVLLFASIFGGSETPESSGETAPGLGSLSELEKSLLSSPPEDYAATLEAWRKSIQPSDLAGIVIEGPRGEVIASSGSFLDQEGRYYSTAASNDDNRGQAIREASVAEVPTVLASEPPYPTRLRFYSYANAKGEP